MDDPLGIVVRFALYIDLMLLFGVPAFTLYCMPGGRDRVRLSTLVPGAATIGLVLSMLSLAVLAAAMSGVTLGQVDRVALTMTVTGTAAGSAWLVRSGALVLALVLCIVPARHEVRILVVAVAGGVALASLAWTGHGAMDDGRTGLVHLVADVVHLLAAGVWVGALAALALLLFRPASRIDVTATHKALAGFAPAGTLAVATIVATGLVNSWLLVGPDNVLTLGSTLYGRLLLAKLALFGTMLALAAVNRFRLTPALAAASGAKLQAGAIHALRRSLVIEAGCATLILALVAWLGTLSPPISG